MQVSLVWDAGQKDRQVVALDKPTKGFTKTPLKFTAGATTDNGRLEIAAVGKGSVSVGTVSLMPADNIQDAGRYPGPLEGVGFTGLPLARVETSSAAMTGRTASATATAGHLARTRPGPASNTTTMASTSSWSFASV